MVTCLVTRAIRLEDLENLETSTIILALERIESETAGIGTYVSDNAPQFLIIRNVLQSTRQHAIAWKLIPAHVPWAGGVYERLVKVVKTSLNVTLREEININYLQFRTVLKRLTLILNDRPLMYISEENEGGPLIPNHLIMRKFNNAELDFTQPLTGTATEAFVRHQMKQSDQIVSTFWRKWSTEYLQFLREKQITHNFRKTTCSHLPRIGDVVIVQDNVCKRKQWNLAKIVQLQRSDDNEVRSAVVQLGSRTKVARPIQHLYYLELNEFEDQGQQIPTTDDGTAMNGIHNIQVD